jgi:membrane protein DedA with SNARE-associated domain
VSWPVSIAKALRTKEVAGKSPWFMILISLGYTSGIIHKTINNPNWVIFLYALNLVMVLIDLSLYLRYSRSKD